jgi:hypothetical protein
MRLETKNPIVFHSEFQLRSCPVFGGYFVKGHMDDYDFEVTLKHNSGEEAIDKGCIVKLEVKYMGGDNDCPIPRPIALYDCKWVTRPENSFEQEHVDCIIALLSAMYV